MKIGEFEFTKPIVLAPMAGVADAPFRRLCANLGADLTPSEMITSDVELWTSEKSRRRLRSWDDITPRIIQIAGYDADMIADIVVTCLACLLLAQQRFAKLSSLSTATATFAFVCAYFCVVVSFAGRSGSYHGGRVCFCRNCGSY